MHNGIVAAGAVLHYLKETEHPNLQHITNIQRIEREDYLWMDRFTIRNLELFGTGQDNGNYLLKVLDNTVSPMGARMLKRWTVLPLRDIKKINERLDLVEYFIKEPDERKNLHHLIKQCGDIERLASKIPSRKINPREVIQLAKGLEYSSQVKQICSVSPNQYLNRLSDALNPAIISVKNIR